MYQLFNDVTILKKTLDYNYSLIEWYKFHPQTLNLSNDIEACVLASKKCDYSTISMKAIENVKNFFIEYNSINSRYLFHQTGTSHPFRSFRDTNRFWVSVNNINEITPSTDYFRFGLKEIENLIVDFNNYQNKIAATENAVEIALPEQKLSLWQRIKGYIHDRTAS